MARTRFLILLAALFSVSLAWNAPASACPAWLLKPKPSVLSGTVEGVSRRTIYLMPGLPTHPGPDPSDNPMDPYFTYLGNHSYPYSRPGHRVPDGYRFQAPDRVEIELPTFRLSIVDRDYESQIRRLTGSETDPAEELVEIAGGSDQRVFRRHGSDEVLKLWGPNVPDQANKASDRVGVTRRVRRNLLIYQVLAEVARDVTLNGRQILRVARIRNLDRVSELAGGLVRQEAVEGETAFMIQRALDLLSGRMLPRLGLDADWAARFLEKVKLSADQAQLEIWALEQFYRDTHSLVMSVNHQLGIDFNLGVWLRESVEADPERPPRTGFDYNHGQNVIWSPAERIWIAVDW